MPYRLDPPSSLPSLPPSHSWYVLEKASAVLCQSVCLPFGIPEHTLLSPDEPGMILCLLLPCPSPVLSPKSSFPLALF